jgi:hypothetical protein
MTSPTDLFSQFLDNNPYSSIMVRGENSAIIEPWGDSSLAIVIPEDEEGASELSEVLNALILPQKYSAIFHLDSNILEVIWTSYKLPDNQNEVKTRSFNLSYMGQSHNCYFSKSSQRLITLSKHAYMVQSSDTYFRNIPSISTYARNDKNDPSYNNLSEPHSFYISNINHDLDSDDLHQLIDNINFYMTYFDYMSPYILIHQSTDIEHEIEASRYPHGSFPSTINARPLNDTLKRFWFAGKTGDESKRFTYMYRIIEYAAHYYIQNEIRTELKKTLTCPLFDPNSNETIEKIVSNVFLYKADEFARYDMIFKSCVRNEALWPAIESNIDYFCQAIEFDGGFSVPALLAKKCRKEDFLVSSSLPKQLRDIRNALSHGRDQKTGTVITPTQRNSKLLQPWLPVITAAAGEVILFHDSA